MAETTTREGLPDVLTPGRLFIDGEWADAAGGGTITVCTDDVRVDAGHPMGNLAEGEYVRLRVVDTGVGMSEEVRSKAFDPFFTTKPVGKGTGLGLSTILGYVEQSHGVANIESKPGRGTTIHVVLPRAPRETLPEEA